MHLRGPLQAASPGAKIAAQLSITDSAAGTPQLVGLNGVGVTPAFNLSASGLDFGNVVVGQTSAAQTITLTNSTNGPLAIAGVFSTNPAFFLAGNTCVGQTIPAGATCQIGVHFQPAAVGPSIWAVTINYYDGAGGFVSAFVSLIGNGITADLAVTPGSLNFGDQQLNTSSDVQTVTVTNTSGAPVSITGVSTTGDFATFANTCVGQTLAPNATCTIGVRFTPTATGQRTGTLVIANTGATTPIVVSLTGNGISAQLSVTPGSLDFGPHQLGTNTAAQTVTVKNIGTGTVTITATALAGSDPTNFEITGNTCQPSGNDVTLAAGQECTISVRFTPAGLVAGNRSALLNITSNAPTGSSVMSVGLSGIATTAAVYVTPASLDFGDQQIGTTSVAKTVTLTNVGSGPVGVLTPTISGNFAIFANTCALATLAPGDSCTIGVVFQPAAPGGPKTGTLSILDSASPLVQTVSLTGNAISAQLSVTPASLDFGNQAVGVPSAAQTVTVKNIGSGPVTITATAPLIGTHAGDFQIVADTCQPAGNDVTLGAGESCTISVRFIPTAIGPRNAQLQITSSAPTAGSTVAVGLTGFGVTSGPAISFNPSALDFGSIPVNTSATKTLTVTNTGTAPLIFNASGPAGVVLTGSAYYTITGDGCSGLTILPGESCTVGVTFAPLTQGPATATLTFNTNAPVTPPTVNVTGIGTSAVFTFDPAALNFGPVQVNTTATLTTLVTNHTGGPASITGISGLGGTPFTVVGNSCLNLLLPDGASCAITVTFTPTAVQYYAASLTLNLSTGGTVSIALTGNGVPQPLPLISITPAYLDFGYVQTGQQAPAQTITIKNIGSIDVAIPNVAVTFGNAFFIESADTCTGQVLQPGQQCTVSVYFAPGASTGPLTGAVTVTTNAPSSTHTVPLFGNGITAGLSIAPSSLNFGNVQVGTVSAAQTITVTNTGSGPVNITNWGLIGINPGQFEVVDNTCMSGGNPATLPPGGSCTFAVRFIPTATGAKSAQLSITDSAAGTPQTVGLSGVAVTPAFNLSANGLDFGNIVVGQTSATQTVTLTNSTNGPLTILTVVSSAPSVYLVTGDTCSGQTIPAGATCQIGVQFRPAAVGAANGTLTITYDNGQGGTATVVVQLTGNGISGALGVSPNALNFGYQQVGTTSAAQVVTITGNPGGSVQIVSAVVVNGTNFAETGDTCQGQTLAPNGTCTVGVTFTPVSPGQKNDFLRITYNAGSGNQVIDIALAGIGVSPALNLSANGLDFGYQQVNTSSLPQTVTVTNSTNGPLTLTNPNIVGGTHFQESGDTCNGLTLAPNQSCTIGVIFRPTAVGPQSDTLRITYLDGQGNNVNVNVALNGIGITAQVSVTPASLDFGNVQTGSASPAQTVTVKNVGAGPVSVTNFGIIGANAAEFEVVGNTCMSLGNPATLPPGGTCTFAVRFIPATGGSKIAQLSITDSASGTPQLVGLSGTGVTPAISVTPASLTFGPQQIGIDSDAQLVTVKNIGNGPVTVGAIVAAANPPFRVVDNQCTGQTLAPNATCTFAVVFNSANAGTFNGTVSITTDAPVPATVTTVTLVGTATNATLYVSTPTVDFGTVQVGTTAGPKSVTLTNVGSGPILITVGPALGGTNPADFAHSNGCTGATLLPGQSCTIQVTFTPSAVGPRSATLTVTDNASGSPQVITLTGVGINPGFTLSATGLDFGYQQVGTTSPAQTLRLTNNSTGPLTISTVGIANGSHFQITGENCSNRTFGPGQFCEIGVVFKPTAAGPQNDILQVVYNNGATNVTLGVTLTGIGITAQVSVTPASLDFGNRQVGTASGAQTVTVKNVGAGPVNITNYGIIGADASQFEVLANTCMSGGNPATLPPGAECTISVRFIPTSVGAKIAQLSITDSSSGTPHLVGLTGVGITPNLEITPASLDFGNWQVGTTSPAQTVTVRNIGSGPVTISSSQPARAAQFTVVDNTCLRRARRDHPGERTCQISVVFNPTSAGVKTALTIGDTASGTPQTVSLTGIGITAQVSVTRRASTSATSRSAPPARPRSRSRTSALARSRSPARRSPASSASSPTPASPQATARRCRPVPNAPSASSSSRSARPAPRPAR
ncbi:MAG: choice-of-anchor D domain-containing protein [Chloroflexia bacterium]